MALGAVAANAQAIQTVEIQGTVDSWYTGNGMYVIDPALLNAATFKFMVNQDISVAPYSDTYAEHIDSEYKDYYNNVRRIGVTFYDSEGVEISTSYATEVLANEMISSFKRARNDRTADELFSVRIRSGAAMVMLAVKLKVSPHCTVICITRMLHSRCLVILVGIHSSSMC